MENNENLVGLKINLAKLCEALASNNHKLKVFQFMEAFYQVFSEMEAENPAFQKLMAQVSEQDYNDFVCALTFSLCVKLAGWTLTEEAFIKMMKSISNEEIEIDEKALN